MNTEKIDALVQTELTADAVFQATLASMTTDEEKTNAITAKKNEILLKKAPEWFTEAETHKKNYEDQKTRAEKAETGKKKKEGEGDEPKEADFTSTEVIQLMGAQVTHVEDLGFVKEAMALYKKPLHEVLNMPLIKAELKQKADFRKSAEASNIDPKRPGNKGVTDAEILDRASKGEVFKKGSPEAEAYFWAKRGGKKS